MDDIRIDVYFSVISKETRYAVFDNTTDVIIDDAQGYGYKTKEKAYAAYNHNITKERLNKKKIENWCNEHPLNVKDFDYIKKQILERRSNGEDINFTVEDLKDMLDCSGHHYDFDVKYLWNMYFSSFNENN